MQFEALGPYEKIRDWGRSPAGRILRAHDPETGSEVSIQLFDAAGESSEAASDRVHEELLRTCGPLVELRHPHLARVLDVDRQDGSAYLVSEAVEGTSCEVFCRADSLLEPARAVELAASAARGLAELHRAGLVHGAVQPATLVRTAGGVKLTGFGLAICTDVPAIRDSRYQSPEQVRREPLDARSDVFSLGGVLYEWLAGRPAFPGSSSAVLYRIVNEELSDPRSLVPAPHEAVCEILRKALAKRRSERFESGEQLAEALEAAAVVLGVDAALDVGSSPFAPPPRPVVPRPSAPARTRLRPFLLGAVLVALLAIAVTYTFVIRDEKPPPGARPAPVAENWLTTRVRTEPPGALVLFDGEPVQLEEGGDLRFRAGAPFGLLSASYECRTVERELDPADAGGEVVLVMDPIEVEVDVDPGVAGVRLLVNGKEAGKTPTAVHLDLCRDNRLELRAEGYRPAAVEIPSGASPLDARTRVYAVGLEPIPRGRVTLRRDKSLQLVYYIDGKRVDKTVRELELDAGEHELRFKNDFHWLDVTKRIEVVAGETLTPDVSPSFGTLTVQAFPSNCKVHLRRSGTKWRFLDDTPAERRVAAGEYEVKIELIPTGETRVERVNVTPGANPPVRVAFGGKS